MPDNLNRSAAFNAWRSHMAHVRTLDIAGERMGFIIMLGMFPVAYSLHTGRTRFDSFHNDNRFTIRCR